MVEITQLKCLCKVPESVRVEAMISTQDYGPQRLHLNITALHCPLNDIYVKSYKA